MEETKRKKQIVNRLDRTNFEELLIRFIYFGQ